MKAIKITQQDKEANKKLLNNIVVGSIIIKDKLPKNWNNISNFDNVGDVIHEENRFYYVEQPILNQYEKRGVIYFDDIAKLFKYTIIPFTQEEIDNAIQQEEDNDISAQKESKLKSDGILAYDRVKSYVRRKLDKGDITNAQFNGIYRPVRDALFMLNFGDWDIAKENWDAINPPTNATLLYIYNTIKSKIDNYVPENY